jgi:glycine cleavage system aminomethyltransferase T
LTGYLPEAGEAPPPGTLLLEEPGGLVLGHVTRSGYAPSARRPVALGLLAGGPARIGARVAYRLSGEWRWAAVASATRIGLPVPR